MFTHQKKQDYMNHFSRQTDSTKNRHCPVLHTERNAPVSRARLLQEHYAPHEAPKTALRSSHEQSWRLQATPYIPMPKGRGFTASFDKSDVGHFAIQPTAKFFV
jgi:hypothetical protein